MQCETFCRKQYSVRFLVQAEMRQRSAGLSVLRPSDAWAMNQTAPAYNSFPSDIRHKRTQQNLVNNNCELPSLQQSQFEEVQLGMLLGGSSSGNVYRGMWRSIPVAVKVGSSSPAFAHSSSFSCWDGVHCSIPAIVQQVFAFCDGVQ